MLWILDSHKFKVYLSRKFFSKWVISSTGHSTATDLGETPFLLPSGIKAHRLGKSTKLGVTNIIAYAGWGSTMWAYCNKLSTK